MRRFILTAFAAAIVTVVAAAPAAANCRKVRVIGPGDVHMGYTWLGCDGYNGGSYYPQPQPYYGGNPYPRQHHHSNGGGDAAGAALVGGIFGLAAGAIIAGTQQQAPACTVKTTYDQYGRVVETVKRCPAR